MLKVYNTLSQKKELLRSAKKIKFFVCGPTVYDHSHLGHARSYVAFDLIAKYLKHLKHKVYYIQNITDIDDKIIQRAKEKKTTPLKLAREFEKEHLRDMKTLRVNSVIKYARATDHIREIISQIQRLIDKDIAYQIQDGIYYDISQFKDYGKLSRRTVIQAEDAVSKIDQAKDKKNKGDFCLWKKSKKGEPAWNSPWFKGRPGWHIEDTAITEKHFGPQYDIHGGGKDLIFPHHEAEIAQMEAISNKKPMVRYWLHNGFLTVGGKKMSKSLGNFIIIKDFFKKYSPRLLRFLIIKNHYRSSLDFNDKSIVQAKKELNKIDDLVAYLQNNPKGKSSIVKIKQLFQNALDDDFNTPRAIASIFQLMRIKSLDARATLKFLKQADEILDVIFWKEETPKKVLQLIEKRENYRKKKDWIKADELRKEINRLGFQIEDTAKQTKLKRI